jgi:multiple sugar transport system substrate-binding protein
VAELTFLGCDQDAYCASLERHVGEFEEASGHAVNVRILGSDEYFTNQLDAHLSGDSPADVFMSGPVLVWEHVGKGLVEPLDPFLDRASSGFDPADFVPALLRSNRWSGRFGERLGSGPLLEVPVNCESYNLAYVPELLERAGVEVPSTWDEYFAAAAAIVEGAPPSRGFAQRGTDAWHTIYTGFASQLWAEGATDFDETGACAIAEPPALETTTAFLRALRAAGRCAGRSSGGTSWPRTSPPGGTA